VGITRFDHYTVRSADLDASRRFYERVLGLQVRDREGAPVPAFIVSAGETEVVHVFQASQEIDAALREMTPNKKDPVTWSTWRLQHVEFWAAGLEEMKQRWTADAVPFTERTLPDKHQVGLRDPDDIVVNLNFPLSEVGK
jgi:catechol 2,3-dioxygenase-like lactoylglutathione lyase family enzyme